MKLFVIYIGGDTATSLVELHDMRFVVAETIEDTYPALKASWWGRPESLHIDNWGELTSADGHDIYLKPEPVPEGQDQLWFVNLGGYDPAEFTELHKNVFVVAPNASKAKVRALKMILDWDAHHRDYQFEVEKSFCVADAARVMGLHIHLVKTDTPSPFVFTAKYLPIGKDGA